MIIVFWLLVVSVDVDVISDVEFIVDIGI